MQGSNNIWYWPVPGIDKVTSNFGYRGDIGVEGATADHKGIDIGAPKDSPIVATRAGRVISSGAARGYGNWIRIDHGDGYISIYGHMESNQLYVSEGDEVKAGQLIAGVGSAGTSSGYHLHFQLELHGVPQDPRNYISPGGPSVVSPSYTPHTESPDDTGSISSAISGNSLIGYRVSELTIQPVHAFVNIYVGDDLLTATDKSRPNIIQSFEFTRLDDAGENCHFVLFDDNWVRLERLLSLNPDNIYIRYGYAGSGVQSKLYRHRLLSYNLEFNSTGVIMSVKSVSESVVKNLEQKTIGTDTYNPTEAVKKICQAIGYKVIDSNFDKSVDVDRKDPYNLIMTEPISYIYSVIMKEAHTDNGELFSFYVEEENGEQVAYFKKIDYATNKSDNIRTYIYQKGYDSSVINFYADINAVFGGKDDFAIATGYRTTLIDENTKTQVSLQEDIASAIIEAAGDRTHTSSKQSTPIIDSAGYTQNQMKNRLEYYMKSNINNAYKATLEIVGDPTITLRERYIRIINITDDGTLHHTSGVYTIMGIKDSISGGSMITSLELVKSATFGDAVEILNPKFIMK